MNDLRFALRQLLKNPGFTAVAVLTLALGIGANTAIFSLVNAIMLRPPPFPAPGRLIYLSERSSHLDGMSISYPNLVDWQKQTVAFENIAGFRSEGYNLTGGDTPERVTGLSVSANFFATLGVAPLQGRVFGPDEDRAGATRVAVISQGLWERRFGRDVDILGRSIELDAQSHTVIGIMPVAFQFPREVELWTSLGILGEMPSWQNRGNHPGIYAIARLKPGVTVEQGRADMDAITGRLAQEYPDTNARSGASVMTLRERMVSEPRPALLMLLGAVGFVLLIACANLDEKFALKYWKDADPVGKRISTGDTNKWLTIVGVVAHVKNYGVDRHSREEIYLPVAQHPTASMTLVVKAGNASVAAAIRAAVRELDPDQPLTTFRSMEQILGDSIAPRRIAMLLLSAFSGLALALAAVGIYGVMAYSASQRTREIGVRMALGARPADVLALVLGQSGRLVLAGVVLGLAAALALTRLMGSLVFDVKPSDPITYALTPAVLLSVAFLASYLPARRAARVDPMEALRYE